MGYHKDTTTTISNIPVIIDKEYYDDVKWLELDCMDGEQINNCCHDSRYFYWDSTQNKIHIIKAW